MTHGVFGLFQEKSYVCLDCGHVENYCIGSNLDAVRRKAEQDKEKERRKMREAM